MNKLLAVFIIFFGSYSSAFAAFTKDAVGNWYLSKFPDLQVSAVPEGFNPDGTMYELARMKENTDMRSLTKDENETALGEFTANSFSQEVVNATQWIFGYNSAVGDHPGPFFLYAYQIQSCAADEEYSKSEHMCVAEEPKCSEGETSLRSGFSSHLVQTAPYTVYILDKTPEKMCLEHANTTKTCIYNKPAKSHSC